jgi:hypothetical protein
MGSEHGRDNWWWAAESVTHRSSGCVCVQRGWKCCHLAGAASAQRSHGMAAADVRLKQTDVHVLRQEKRSDLVNTGWDLVPILKLSTDLLCFAVTTIMFLLPDAHSLVAARSAGYTVLVCASLPAQHLVMLWVSTRSRWTRRLQSQYCERYCSP